MQGRTFLNGIPIKASVEVMGTDIYTVSSEDNGSFELEATSGDVLKIIYKNEVKEMYVQSIHNELLVFFTKDIELLDEVELRKLSKTKIQERHTEIMTPLGKNYKTAIGIATQTLRGEDLNQAVINLREGIQNKHLFYYHKINFLHVGVKYM